MSSNRYRAIVALLDDPLNRLAITRELIRRGKVNFLPPPVQILRDPSQREVLGYVFPTTRQALRSDLPYSYRPEEIPEIDIEAHVFSTGDGKWFVTLVTQGDSELGPFNSLRDAHRNAVDFLEGEGFTLLGEIPWDSDDVRDYPVSV